MDACKAHQNPPGARILAHRALALKHGNVACFLTNPYPSVERLEIHNNRKQQW